MLSKLCFTRFVQKFNSIFFTDKLVLKPERLDFSTQRWFRNIGTLFCVLWVLFFLTVFVTGGVRKNNHDDFIVAFLLGFLLTFLGYRLLRICAWLFFSEDGDGTSASKKIKETFFYEISWRLFVVFQVSSFVVMMWVWAESRGYSSSFKLPFPRVIFTDVGDLETYISILYYGLLPYLITRSIDWVLAARGNVKSDGSE